MLHRIQYIILSCFLLACNETPRLWPDGEIPFIPIGLSEEELPIIIKAMAEWEFATGGIIKFKLTDQIGDGILHVQKAYLGENIEGKSSLGYSEDNPRFLLVNCDGTRNKIILHELGHTIGLFDNYIDTSSIMYYQDIYDSSISPIDILTVRDMYYDPDGFTGIK